MYTPQHFAESRVEVLHDLIRRHPLAALVVLTDRGLTADHVPLVLAPDPAPFGTLQGHVARVNPVWADARPEVEAVAIFQGPHAYVSPAWYPTKQETGKVVPTWDYAVVHAYGTLRSVDDPAWVRGQIDRLTAQQEAGSAEPWRPADAPAEYIRKLIGAVVGVELVVTRLEGKWKVSQNRPAADRAGVVAGLTAAGTPDSAAVAELVGEYGPDAR